MATENPTYTAYLSAMLDGQGIVSQQYIKSATSESVNDVFGQMSAWVERLCTMDTYGHWDSFRAEIVKSVPGERMARTIYEAIGRCDPDTFFAGTADGYHGRRPADNQERFGATYTLAYEFGRRAAI